MATCLWAPTARKHADYLIGHSKHHIICLRVIHVAISWILTVVAERYLLIFLTQREIAEVNMRPSAKQDFRPSNEFELFEGRSTTDLWVCSKGRNMVSLSFRRTLHTVPTQNINTHETRQVMRSLILTGTQVSSTPCGAWCTIVVAGVVEVAQG